MTVTQVYELLNTVTQEVTGESDLVKEDLSNVVDIGTALYSSEQVDNYVKTLVDHIGKVIFVNRLYNGSAPSVLMDSWEFGSIMEKIQCDLPESEADESWQLTNGSTYNQDKFYKPSVSVKFFDGKVGFEIPISIPENQVKSSFDNETQLNAFYSMIYTTIENSLTIKLDELIMRTVNNMTAQTLLSEYPTPDETDEGYADKSGVRAVNLLYLYNTQYSKSLTAATALSDPDFVKFASYTMCLYETRLHKMSTLFNIGGKQRFTPPDQLHFIMLADFADSAKIYLQSDTFNKELVALPTSEIVPYWQGSGLDYDFTSTSKINVTIKNGTTTADVEVGGILAVAYDRNALGVTNLNKRITYHYNAKGEFHNSYYKSDAHYFNDCNENFVVFFVA